MILVKIRKVHPLKEIFCSSSLENDLKILSEQCFLSLIG